MIRDRTRTFNIRYGSADDGPNAWPHRRELVAGSIRRFSPDVLAIQVGVAFQLEELDDTLGARESEIIHERVGDVWLSDHFPVTAVVPLGSTSVTARR